MWYRSSPRLCWESLLCLGVSHHCFWWSSEFSLVALGWPFGLVLLCRWETDQSKVSSEGWRMQSSFIQEHLPKNTAGVASSRASWYLKLISKCLCTHQGSSSVISPVPASCYHARTPQAKKQLIRQRKFILSWVEYAYNSSIQEAEAGGLLDLRPCLPT